MASVGLLALTGCGTSEHIAERDVTSQSPSSSTQTTPATPAPSSAPTPKPTQPATQGPSKQPPSGEVDPHRVQGVVYSLSLPPGWEVTTKSAQREAQFIDLAITHPLPSGGFLSLTVFDTGEVLLPSQVGSSAYRDQLVEQVSDATHTAVTPIPTIRIDRQQAIGIKTTGSFLGQNASFTIYLPSRFNQLYTIVLATSPGAESVGKPAFARILKSWDWV